VATDVIVEEKCQIFGVVLLCDKLVSSLTFSLGQTFSAVFISQFSFLNSQLYNSKIRWEVYMLHHTVQKFHIVLLEIFTFMTGCMYSETF
jgi:hypothetical protein